MMSYPISLHLQGKKCIVFGAGTIAQRRVQGLLQAGAMVTVVAPESKPICWEHIALTYLQGRYHPELLTDFFLVFAATNDPVINAQIVRASQEKGKLVSTVTTDPASTADFSLPACRRSGAVTLAITTEGTAPALATAIGNALLPELANYETLCTCIHALRRTWKEIIPEKEQRIQLFRKITTPAALTLFREQGKDAYLQYAAQCFGTELTKKSAILVVSFGTAYAKTREQTIGAVERTISKAFPKTDVFRAFTSRKIVHRMRQTGIAIDTVSESIERLKRMGYTQVFCQPTYLVPGREYERLCSDLEVWKNAFFQFSIGEPLLSQMEDYPLLIQALEESGIITHSETELYLLVGHGTSHIGNLAYLALEDWLKHSGYSNVLVGTIGGYPTLEMVLKQLNQKGCSNVILIPMLLVAGKHVQQDIAGEKPNSWKSVLEQNGYSVTVRLQGLGAFPAIQRLYLAHLQKIVADIS